MTIFSPRTYIWLASHQRDEIHIAGLMSSEACVFAIQSTYRLAQALSDASPGFDPELFLRNCGLDTGTEPSADEVPETKYCGQCTTPHTCSEQGFCIVFEPSLTHT